MQVENKIELNVDDYVDSFKPTLMDIVYKVSSSGNSIRKLRTNQL